MDFYKFFIPGPLYLPIDILELVFSYIPTAHLWAYSDIPIINEHVIKALNDRGVEITIGDTLYKRGAYYDRIEEQWGKNPIGDETLLEPFGNPDAEGCPIRFQDVDNIEDFIEFMKDRPNLRPRLNICGLDTLIQLDEKEPSLIQRAQSILFVNKPFLDNSDNESGVRLIRASISSLPIDEILTLESWFYDGSLPSLERFQFGRCPYQISSLELHKVETTDLIYLPSSLKILEIHLKSNPVIFKPNLPTSLEKLRIRFAFHLELIDEFDIAVLESLKALECTNFPAKYFATLKAPEKIERIHLESETLICLDGIEKYNSLCRLFVSFRGAEAGSIFNCNLPNSIERLHFGWYRGKDDTEWHSDTESYIDRDDMLTYLSSSEDIPDEFPSIRLPPKLKFFSVIAQTRLFCPEQLVFPDSLRIPSKTLQFESS